MTPLRHLEDLTVGETDEFGRYEITEAEIIEFGERFDPQPWHLDHEAARASVFGELVTCACHLGCIVSALHNQNPRPLAIVAGLGGRENNFRAPGRVGDIVRLRLEVMALRRSASRPGTGIIEMRSALVDQDDRVLTDNVGVILVAARTTSSPD